MNDPTSRTLALLSLLQTHRHWKGFELADRLGVSERRVRRVVDRLRSLGYPVDAEPGADGGYRLATGAHLPPLLLDDDEAIALVVGIRAAATSSIEGIEQTTVALMAKLDTILPDRLRRRVDALQASVEVLTWPSTMPAVPPASLTTLSQGCRDREEVRFDYERRDGERSRRLVQPHQLVSAGRRWYLVAWDVRRDDWRTFRVDRLTDPELAGVRFEPRPLPAPDAASFVAASMRAMTVEHRAVVEVAATPEDLAAIGHWFDSTPEPLGVGRSRLELRSESIDWLASMVGVVASRFDVEVTEAGDEVRRLIVTMAARLAHA